MILEVLKTLASSPPVFVSMLEAAASQAAKDASGCLMSVAENRGRGHLAAALNVGGILANVAATVFGAGSVLSNGIDERSILVIASMCLVGYVGTRFWTHISQDIRPA